MRLDYILKNWMHPSTYEGHQFEKVCVHNLVGVVAQSLNIETASQRVRLTTASHFFPASFATSKVFRCNGMTGFFIRPSQD